MDAIYKFFMTANSESIDIAKVDDTKYLVTETVNFLGVEYFRALKLTDHPVGLVGEDCISIESGDKTYYTTGEEQIFSVISSDGDVQEVVQGRLYDTLEAMFNDMLFMSLQSDQ